MAILGSLSLKRLYYLYYRWHRIPWSDDTISLFYSACDVHACMCQSYTWIKITTSSAQLAQQRLQMEYVTHVVLASSSSCHMIFIFAQPIISAERIFLVPQLWFSPLPDTSCFGYLGNGEKEQKKKITACVFIYYSSFVILQDGIFQTVLQ